MDGVVGFSLPFNSAPTDDVTTALETYSCVKLVPFFCDRDLTAKTSAAGGAMGMAKRANMLSELARNYHDQAPALYLTDAFDVFALSRKVEGFAVANRIPVYETVVPTQ
jgi:hypothetical protein